MHANGHCSERGAAPTNSELDTLVIIDKMSKTGGRIGTIWGTKPRCKNVSARLAKPRYENGLIFRTFAADVIRRGPPICRSETKGDPLIIRLRATLDTILDVTKDTP